MVDRVNILLVDDQPAKLLGYEAILGQLGENLIKAESGPEAMEILLRTSVAVVLVDVRMPGMDGFALTDLIRKHPRFRETAVILVSGVHVSEMDRLRGYDSGAVDYVPVPFVPELLRAKVRVFVDLYRKTRTLQEMKDELERRVEERTSELRRSNEELQQFVYVASHDLQEPLRMISSFAQLLGKRFGKKIGSEGEEFVRYVVDGVQRMHQLINDLLAYSRLDRSDAIGGVVDCQKALEYAQENLRVALSESGAGVEHGPLPVVRGDETQIVQLLQNLVSNAIKFRREDDPPKIRVEAVVSGNDWLFSVHDNGIGIDPAHSERIFQMFQRLHGREEYAGTGIGLAICKKIVERHHGRIWVDAKAKGSVFRFTLPGAGDGSVRPPPWRAESVQGVLSPASASARPPGPPAHVYTNKQETAGR